MRANRSTLRHVTYYYSKQEQKFSEYFDLLLRSWLQSLVYCDHELSKTIKTNFLFLFWIIGFNMMILLIILKVKAGKAIIQLT